MAKKKIKDLTLEECKKICENSYCRDCPIKYVCGQTPIYYDDEDLKAEIIKKEFETEIEVESNAKKENSSRGINPKSNCRNSREISNTL